MHIGMHRGRHLEYGHAEHHDYEGAVEAGWEHLSVYSDVLEESQSFASQRHSDAAGTFPS